MTSISDRPESITILMPCKDQKKEFFTEAVRSVVGQTSPHWLLLILTDPDSPAELARWTAEFGDGRLQLLRCPRSGFAQALNHGLQIAATPFVSILLSDDRYAPNAIGTLLACRAESPRSDFFHSSRRHIDQMGDHWGPIMPSRAEFSLDYFQTSGSPVKHLLCWRRELSLAIGGMDETLSLHGCDDYDFPWRMAEAGARFQAIAECLYEYRLHHAHSRLTTTVPLTEQTAVLRRIFKSHAVDACATDRYVQQALDGYLIKEFTDQIDLHRGAQTFVPLFREADANAIPPFLAAGFKLRHWFPHRVYVLPKGGPDGMKLAQRMIGCGEAHRMREFVLYAAPSATAEFPREIFYDDNLQWHQQQFGKDGQIACANVLVENNCLRTYLLVSDLVQRVSRVQRYRTRIDTRFKGWSRLLLNSVLNYAAENGFPTVYVACAGLVLRHTDQARNPKPALYERIYDHLPRELGGVLEGDWWRLDIDRLKNRIVPLSRRYELDEWPKTVCIIHDIERGMGHLDTHPEFARQADIDSPAALRGMLEIEAGLDVRATYNVVGTLLSETRRTIERGRHAVAFHSYDHQIASDARAAILQFRQCRDLDYRIKGYRLPQSKMVPGLTDADFAASNFEWMASSRSSLGQQNPLLSNSIVKIPVHIDDNPMFRGEVDFDEWRRKVLKMAGERDFLVIGLHDCYAGFWLDNYQSLLRELQSRATLITLDEVAARVTLGRSRWFEEAV